MICPKTGEEINAETTLTSLLAIACRDGGHFVKSDGIRAACQVAKERLYALEDAERRAEWAEAIYEFILRHARLEYEGYTGVLAFGLIKEEVSILTAKENEK